MGLFDRFRKPKGKRRVAVIGLDGVGAPLVEALTDAGVMPRMAALRRAGTLARMTSTIPTISSVSWSGFMTGANPGRHGIYGFTDVKRDSYAVYFPNYRHVQAPTIWDVLGAEGRRSIVLNIPNTYPAKDINGVLVSGFVAVDATIGELVDALPDGTPLFVIADHGHTLIETEFYPNVWLRQQGLLAFKTSTPKSIADLDPSSKAFILDPGRIYLNLKGRFAN